MDYKEKYEQAMFRMNKWVEGSEITDPKEVAEFVFPELKESDDEKIRKIIYNCVKWFGFDSCFFKDVSQKECLVWLEKQKDYNSINFKEAEKEKKKHVSNGFMLCKANYQDFKEGEHYWLEYLGNDKYNVRSDNLLGKTYHITPQALYLVFRPLTWLEKQRSQKPVINMTTPEESLGIDSKTYNKIVDECIYGEQKPTDKVEPKFKVGDFIVGDYCMGKVIELTNDAYLLDSGQGIPFSCEHDVHLWTILDAKEGDVLSFSWEDNDNKWEKIVIFKHFYQDGIEGYGNTFKNGKLAWEDENVPYYSQTWTSTLEPSTKEQRDLLFSKMKEAGYEWDAEKKELKKIEQSPANVFNIDEKPLLEKFKQAVYDCAWGKVTCKKEGETQEEYAERWAEQFLLMVRDWADDYIDNREIAITRRAYAKGKADSLKEHKPVWSEEDKLKMDTLIHVITNQKGSAIFEGLLPEELVNWLKSLKERYS